MKDWNSIGRNIRKYRKEKKLSQEQLAEIIHVSQNYVGNMERGEKIPSLETLVAIADALGVSSDVLLHDVVENGYDVKISLLNDEMRRLSSKDQKRIFELIEVEIRHSTQVK
ncbi:MAG: helix-turn-helix transcriptional regulator [Clostridia bacterium]|nr:helix-turn-helix transcriptional regulator [Clostridia bacterium]